MAARLLYAAPGYSVHILSAYRQYGWTLESVEERKIRLFFQAAYQAWVRVPSQIASSTMAGRPLHDNLVSTTHAESEKFT
jgi:hypothetical protein